MQAIILPVFHAVLTASWQASMAILLVLLVRQALGLRAPARWRYLLWTLVLVRLLVPAFVLPHHAASLENIRVMTPPFERALPEPPPAIARPVFVAPALAPAQPPLWEWAAAGWLTGALGFAGWFGACALRLRREVFEVDEATLTIWRECCQRLRLSHPPRLRAADWIASPALAGLVRPVLLVPRVNLRDFSARDWEHVFAHEIAHLRCRDHWVQLLQLAALCAHWFNPLVWLGFRRLRADRELAADEWALRRLETGRALAYGDTLLKVLAGRAGSFQPGLVGIGEEGAQMTQRLRRITAFLPRRRAFGSACGFAAALGLGTVLLGQRVADPPAKDASVVDAANAKREWLLCQTRVTADDGTPAADGTTAVYSHSPVSGVTLGGSAVVEKDGAAPMWIPADAQAVNLVAVRPEFAPSFAGPFLPPLADQLKSQALILTRGFAASILVVNEVGQPVRGVKIEAYYPGPPLIDKTKASGLEVTTDALGGATFRHLAAAPVNLRYVGGNGRAEEVVQAPLDAAKPFRWTVHPPEKIGPAEWSVTINAMVIALPKDQALFFTEQHRLSADPAEGLKALQGLVREKQAQSVTNPSVTTMSGQKAMSDSGTSLLEVDPRMSPAGDVADVNIEILSAGKKIATSFMVRNGGVKFLGSFDSKANETSVTNLVFVQVNAAAK